MALSYHSIIMLTDMDITREIEHLLDRESHLWETVREKWICTTLHAGSNCRIHEIREGINWLYDLFDSHLIDFEIIDNPYQFNEHFEQTVMSPKHDYGLNHLLSSHGSGIFWPIISLKGEGNIDWLMQRVIDQVLQLNKWGEEGLGSSVFRCITHGMSHDGALYYDLSNDCLLKQCDRISLVDFLLQCGMISSPSVADYFRFLSAGAFLSMISVGHAAICKRPKYIKISDSRVHCDDDPAIEWGDGSKWFFLNGIKVPEEVITLPPSEVDPMIVLKTNNAAARMEIIRKLGIETVADRLGGKIVDRWQGYELVRLNIPGMRTVPLYLKMVNPSTCAVHIEGVPSEIMTCREALSWRVGGIEWDPEQLT